MALNGYYRFPTIYKDRVFFVCEDDLWEVSAKGGPARRLTANLGRVTQPAASPDGKWLAFVGREDGESEVYVMPLDGGPAKRLTYFGSLTFVLGWTPDAKQILFANNVAQPFFPLTYVYAVSPQGGHPEQLPFGPARTVSYGPDGKVVIGRRSNDLANWKRYRGGTAGDIWVDNQGKGNFKLLLKNSEGNKACPMWINKRIYFLSDHEGIANIYSCTPTGKSLQRHTHHEDYYVRNPSTDGKRIVYRAGAELYLFDPAAKSGKANPRKIDVSWASPQIERNRKFVSSTTYLDYYAIHPKGHSVAFNVRGKSFSMSNWEGAAIQHGEAHGVRYRLVRWLRDGKRLIMVSDATGEETFEIHTRATNSNPEPVIERLAGVDIGRPHLLEVSPTQDAIVFANQRQELLHFDLKRKKLKQLDKSKYNRINSIEWSPDGRWVAYNFWTSHTTSAIKLCRVDSGECHFVTEPNRLFDIAPSFSPNGKYLFFISYRDFNPVYDTFYFDLNFLHGGRPYLVTLQDDLPNPFIPLPNGTVAAKKDKKQKPVKERVPKSTAGKRAKKKKKLKKSDPAKLPPFQIDLDDIQSRVTAFPVPEGRYYKIKGINKNKVLFTSFPVEGSFGGAWSDNNNRPKPTLEVYDLTERKKDTLLSGVYSFNLSLDRNFMIYYSGSNLRVLKAGEKPDNNASGQKNKKGGWIDLNRAKVAVNPPDEWQQMFREAWRLQRDQFWVEDMSSVDWQSVYERYYPLVDRVACRSEFSDLLWEMQGELGTSHAYELGGDYRPSPRYFQGFLGADFAYDPESGGYRITHIVQGDSWLEHVDSPLNRLGVNVKVGDILMAIDEQRLSQDVTPEKLLVNRANSEVQLTLLDPEGTQKKPRLGKKKAKKGKKQAKSKPTRTVLVKTLKFDRIARYREWVEANRRTVHEATEGRVGYVHVPDMSPFGYAEFHRYYLAESERDGLIVDVRFNGGGHVSQLLLEKLARRRIGYDQSRYGEVSPYPAHSVLGPIVALTNEYAGSDGDIFSHAFKLMGLGPLIGKRTWGGVIGIWPRHSLVDGTLTTQPEFSYWFEDVGWAVENYGTDPDIEVEITPQQYTAGEDPQLERGLKEITRLMKENPPKLPDFGPRPKLSLPTLPKIKKK